LQASHPRLGQQGERGLGDELAAAGRDRFFDRTDALVEADTEVGIVPADLRTGEPGPQEPQIGLQGLQIEGVERHGGVDAERAREGAAEASDHRDDLQQRRLGQGGFDELPAAFHARQRLRLPRGRELEPLGAVVGAILQDLGYERPVGESEHVVEIPGGILGVATSVGTAEDRDRSLGTEEVAERVSQLGGVRETADEDRIAIGRQFLGDVFQPGVAHEPHIVTQLLAPYSDDLGHDAGQVRVHDARVERSRRCVVNDIDDAYAKSAHRLPFAGGLPPVSLGPTAGGGATVRRISAAVNIEL